MMSENANLEFEKQLELLLSTIHSVSTDGKVAVYEAIVRLADSYQLALEGFEYRIELLQAAVNAGQHEKAIVAYAWCLARYDEAPENFDDQIYNLAWYYKWVIDYIAAFPSISRQKILATFDDMARRYTAWGYSLRPVYDYKWSAAIMLGDPAMAEEFHAKWREAPKDIMANCAACEVDTEVNFYLWKQDLEKALKVAKPLLDRRLLCEEVPTTTYCKLLVPLVLAGEHERALAYQNAGRKFKHFGTHLERAGQHITCFVLVRQPDKAKRLFVQYLPAALQTRNVHQRLEFYKAAWLLFADLQHRGRTKTTMRVPKTAPWYDESASYRVESVTSWLDNEIQAAALAFDRRNGNNYVTQQTLKAKSLLNHVRRDPKES